MKNILFAILFSLVIYSTADAQLKIGYVDSDAILDQLPDAQDARTQLDQIIQEWQNELADLEREWKTKYDEYDRKKLIMSDQTRADAEKVLINLEKQIAEFREKKFGTNGELFQKQEELMKPVQNRVFNAIQDVAKQDNLDFVFDRSGDILILFAKEEYDITNKVLAKLK